jgi:glycosyltransferase involved in cell wall biosynthesis
LKVSVAIITLNAARDLDRCLASLSFADEVVVLDQHSSDDTAEVCRKHGAALHQTEWLGFGPTKDRAVSLCRNDWVLSIDSDEEVTAELARAIAHLPDDPAEAAFAVNRLSRFLGHWVKHCGWHPEHVVRLFDRRQARHNDKPVHESVETAGQVGRLPGLLHHYTYDTMEQYIDKLNRYTTLAAREQFAAGSRTSLANAVGRSLAAFWRMWLLQAGFRDGWPGYVLCLASSFYVLSKYTKLWVLGRQEGGSPV